MKTDIINIAKKKLPEGIVEPLRTLYSFIPIEKRMGKNYWKFKHFLSKAQWWDSELIEAWQLKKLQFMIQYAYDNVLGYYELYRASKIKPRDIKELKDIRMLPFTSKELLRDNLKDFTTKIIPKRKLSYSTTGGSAGTPFGFYKTLDNVSRNNAFIHSSWERSGWRLGDKTAVLRGSLAGMKDKIWNYNPLSRELHLSSYYLKENYYDQYLNILSKFSPKHLQAYPSAANLFSDLIIENNDIGKIKFDSILLGSENIYEWQLIKLEKAFPGSRIFGFYGHTEENILAAMCEYSDLYHVWPFFGLTEIIQRNGEDTNCGELGELMGTSFWSFGTPFIRYKTGDFAIKGENECKKCRRKFVLLKKIEGRKQEYVVSRDGGYITLTALIFGQHFNAFSVINDMQLYQDSPGVVIVKIVPSNDFSDYDSNEIKTKMESAVNGRINVNIKLVKDVKKTIRGKSKFLEQKLNIKYDGESA